MSAISFPIIFVQKQFTLHLFKLADYYDCSFCKYTVNMYNIVYLCNKNSMYILQDYFFFKNQIDQLLQNLLQLISPNIKRYHVISLLYVPSTYQPLIKCNYLFAYWAMLVIVQCTILGTTGTSDSKRLGRRRHTSSIGINLVLYCITLNVTLYLLTGSFLVSGISMVYNVKDFPTLLVCVRHLLIYINL